MLLPALSKARAKARAISCVNNLKHIGLYMVMYTHDYEGHFPDPIADYYDNVNNWAVVLYKYYDGSDKDTPQLSQTKDKTFHCPAQSQFPWRSYAANVYTPYDAIDTWVNQTAKVMLADGEAPADSPKCLALWNVTWIPEGEMSYRHDNKTNVTFIDGHVETKKKGYFYISASGGDDAWKSYMHPSFK